MAITNCSIKDSNGNDTVTFVNTGSVAIGSDVAEFFIIPDSGFTVRASSFSNNTGTQPWLTSITLEDTDTVLTSLPGYPNADVNFPFGTNANTVKVTVTLNTLYSMPNADTNLAFGIEYRGGQANVVTVYIDDIHDVVTNTTVSTVEGTGITATAATASSVTTTSHSGTITSSLEVVLFSKTFAAASNYYYLNPPVPNLQAGSLDTRYEITNIDTVNANNQVTRRVWTIKYTGNTSVTSADQHSITWLGDDGKKPAVGAVYVPSAGEIYDFALQLKDSTISAHGDQRTVTVSGVPGSQFSLIITKFGEIGTTSVSDTTYNFSTKVFTASATTSGTLTIPDTSDIRIVVDFPAVSANDSYGFDITAVGSTTLNASVAQGSPDIGIVQISALIRYVVKTDSPIHKPDGTGEQRYDSFVLSNVDVSLGENNKSGSGYHQITLVQDCKDGFTYPATAAATIQENFTTSDIAIDEGIFQEGGEVGTTKLSAVRTSSTRMTYTLLLVVNQVGKTGGNITINVDNVIIPDN